MNIANVTSDSQATLAHISALFPGTDRGRALLPQGGTIMTSEAHQAIAIATFALAFFTGRRTACRVFSVTAPFGCLIITSITAFCAST